MLVHFASISFGNMHSVSCLICFALIWHKDTKHKRESEQQAEKEYINGLSLEGDQTRDDVVLETDMGKLTKQEYQSIYTTLIQCLEKLEVPGRPQFVLISCIPAAGLV